MIEGICYYCKKPVNNLAGNPSEWGIPLCHSDEPGKVKAHHIGCVSERLAENEELRKMKCGKGCWELQQYKKMIEPFNNSMKQNEKLQNQLRGSHHICCNYPNRRIGTCNCEVIMKSPYRILLKKCEAKEIEKFLGNVISFKKDILFYNRKPFNYISDWFEISDNSIREIIAQAISNYQKKICEGDKRL